VPSLIVVLSDFDRKRLFKEYANWVVHPGTRKWLFTDEGVGPVGASVRG
jgi:hypothetical protein